RDCLAGRERSAVAQLMLASTTHPYDDRQNAGIVANALNLGSALAVLDVTGSQRAGASAILVGNGKPVARLLGAHSETVDFVDHFRGGDAEHDYSWEERWVREEGYMKIVP